MDSLSNLLKPVPFKNRRKGDAEQLLQEFEDYVDTMQNFFMATGTIGEHTENHHNCSACSKSKACLTLIGGREMDSLMKHVGKVLVEDSYDEAIAKVRRGITAQTNQCMARFKLMREMSQNGKQFSDWWPAVKEQAERCVWEGYDSKTAASDAILQQCDNLKLQKKIISENLSFEDIIKHGVAMEQGEKKVSRVNKEGVDKTDDRVAQLEEQVRALQTGRGSKEGKKCKTCTYKEHRTGKCPGLKLECHDCKKLGHMRGAEICKEPKKTKPKNVEQKTVNQVLEDTDSEESVGRISEVVHHAKEDNISCMLAPISITAVDRGRRSQTVSISLLVDSGVTKTLICEDDWKNMTRSDPKLKPKHCKVKFKPYGTDIGLEMIGRTKAYLTASSGAKISTIVYIVRGGKQSLLGLRDAQELGILQINIEGSTETVCQLSPMKKPPVGTGVISGGETQEDIDRNMSKITDQYPELFKGVGRAKIEPIHIKTDPSVKPVQQKQRPIAHHFLPRFKSHLDELKAAGVVSGPLESSEATGWVSNPVITGKKWDAQKIRVNLDLRDMEKAVEPTHFPMPSAEELRHRLAGSDRFSVIDMNHAFHQFPLDQESSALCTFYTPWGLHRYNTLAMGVHTASNECQEKTRRLLEGCKGVEQIQDDLLVHGKGKIHDENLQRTLQRLSESGFTLRRIKCQFGVPEVVWFGNTFSKYGMSPDPEKVRVIKEWEAPKDKSEVKSFLQTAQFCSMFMRPGGGRTYSDVTKPLRELTSKNKRFHWTTDCQRSFEELKELLVSDSVMANYELDRKTRLYVDHGPNGVGSTVAQQHAMPNTDQTVWRPVCYASRALTKAEIDYSKTEGESLAVYTGISHNRKYLYGTDFEVVVDHEPLVSLYNVKTAALPVRVAKHKSKLRSFQFRVKYEPGSKNPCDYASRHPPAEKTYTTVERETYGIEDEEEDREILVNRIDYGYIPDAVTLQVLQYETGQDSKLRNLKEDIKKGKLRPELEKEYKSVFQEMTVMDEVVMRGDRLLIPKALRADILALAHEGHPGIVSMLQNLRESVWWPKITTDTEQYVETCEIGCAAASARNTPPPMVIRQTPDRPWQHCSADYKGPIGGQYYLHVLIDNFTRFPEVKMTKSTSMKKLYPVLDEVFGVHGIPETITHDNGPPYNSEDWRRYARECGFKSLRCSPEHPEGNGIAERFMRVLVKIIHAAMAENKDPRIEVQRRLLNYRNTPHSSTGASPASLMFNRQIRTKLPAVFKPSQDEKLIRARKRDQQTRSDRSHRRDTKRGAKELNYKPGDKVLISQKKSTIAPPFDPNPFKVVKVIGNQVTAQRGNMVRIRNKAKFKLLKERPESLKPSTKPKENTPAPADDYEWYDGAKVTVAEKTDNNSNQDEGGGYDSEDFSIEIEYADNEDSEEVGHNNTTATNTEPDTVPTGRKDTSNEDSDEVENMSTSPNSPVASRLRRRAKSVTEEGVIKRRTHGEQDTDKGDKLKIRLARRNSNEWRIQNRNTEGEEESE